MSANPTDRFKRYFDNVSTIYNEITAIKSNRMLYSVLFGLSSIDCLSGVFWCKTLLISHGIPSDINMANELAPSEFDTPTPPSFFRIISTLEIPSCL